MEDSACCALFVAFFDPIEGNTLEWSACSKNSPNDKAVLLNNIEMLVLAPGFERMDKEYVTFRHNSIANVFGCSAFHKLSTTDAKERFARMRSVGVMGRSAVNIRKLVPFLTWLATCLNKNPNNFSLVEKASEALFNNVTTIESCLDIFLTDNQNDIEIKTFGEDVTSLKAVPQLQLSIDHSHFLVIWRAILSKYRVLLYSKHNAGLLCDVALDLLCSGCDAVSQPLMFRTYDSDEHIFKDTNNAWFATSTDMRLVLGMGKPVPCWDILIDFDNGSSGVQFKHDRHVVHTTKLQNSTSSENILSSFTIHMNANCDSQVRNCMHKCNNDSMWQMVKENSPNHSTTHACDADRRRLYLSIWWNKLETDIKKNINMETTPGLNQQIQKQRHSNAIKILIKQYAIDSTYISWLLWLCEKSGVDVSNISYAAIVKLKFGLFAQKMMKKRNKGTVVPINS
jgi:hypothetical protein